ncbi:MAG: hypothetical protein O3C06_08760 [Bacteroidetes bacterium]|nr:hypothetical protein [Bacteroidota bacterium]
MLRFIRISGLFNVLFLILLGMLTSCENYLTWGRPTLVSYSYPVLSCDSSYTWIDGNTYTSDNSDATFIVKGDEDVDTLFELELVFYLKSDTMNVWRCDKYTWIDGIEYSESNNTATYLVASSDGCDSLVALDLTIAPLQGVDTITACTSYTWIDGNIYTQSNNSATHLLTTSTGCDSIVTLNLTIAPLQGTDNITACSSYTWIDGNTYTQSNNSAIHLLTTSNGCDSIITLNLTITPLQGTDNITACSSYTWVDGNTYTQSNNSATHLLTTAAGCDSVVTLNLTVLYPTFIYDTVTACGPYTWINGTTYTNNNYSASVTTTGQNGCDETTYLHLTMDCECSIAPNFNCSITTITNGQYYNIGISGTSFTPGQSIVVTMNSSSYNFGQAKNVSLYCNETVVHNFGGWLLFSGNSRTFTIPTFIDADNCFTMRVTKEGPTVSASDDEIWVSNSFNIL